MVFKEVIKKFSVLEYREQNTEYRPATKFDLLNKSKKTVTFLQRFFL